MCDYLAKATIYLIPANVPPFSLRHAIEKLKNSPDFLIKISSSYFKPFNIGDISLEDNEHCSENEVCAVCYIQKSNSVIMDCGHGGLCFPCALKICEQNEKCYICRNPIQKILEVSYREDGIFEVLSTTKIIFEYIEDN